MADDYDFGFSFTSDEPTNTPTKSEDSEKLTALAEKIDSVLSSQTQYVEEAYKAKLKEVEGLILPLLVNLMKNPEKPYIKWENRTEVIQKQIDKIIAITRG